MRARVALASIALLGAVPAASSVAPSPARESTLRRVPEPGTLLRKTWTSEGTRTLQGMQVRAGGRASSPEGLSMELTGSRTLVVEDEYVVVEDGRVTELVRSYEELSAEQTQSVTSPEGDNEHTTSETCQVEGRRVRFVWDADGNEYDKSFADDGDEDDEVLEGLLEDTDMRALLPPGGDSDDLTFAPDDEWDVPFEDFGWVLLRPGGRFGCELDPPRSDFDTDLGVALWESYDGSLDAHFDGGGEHDGRDLIAIGFEGEFAGYAELEPGDPSGGVRSRSVEQESRLRGRLLWDVGAGHPAGFEMIVQSRVRVLDRLLVEADGEERELERESVFSEKARFELEVE